MFHELWKPNSSKYALSYDEPFYFRIVILSLFFLFLFFLLLFFYFSIFIFFGGWGRGHNMHTRCNTTKTTNESTLKTPKIHKQVRSLRTERTTERAINISAISFLLLEDKLYWLYIFRTRTRFYLSHEHITFSW